MKLNKKQYGVAAVLIVVAVFLLGNHYSSQSVNQQAIFLCEENLSDVEQEMAIDDVTVHVAGQVLNPGVYIFSAQCRVDDAVKAAVPLADADLDSLNLAEVLKDGQRIFISSMVTTSGEGIDIPRYDLLEEETLININTATQKELEILPGIGPSLANRIIDYRETHGAFSTIEEIRNVSGIGEKRFADIQERITTY